MKSNFNELFEKQIKDLSASKDIDIEKVLDEIVPLIRFEEPVTKVQLVRNFIRSRLTTALNMNKIYSYEKGHFVSLDKANERQLAYFMAKAQRDIDAAEVRKSKAEMMLTQISMAWDEEGNFIGYHVPKAMGE